MIRFSTRATCMHSADGGAGAHGPSAPGHPVVGLMLRWLSVILLGCGSVGLGPIAASAQDLGTDCELREYTSIRSTEARPGARVTWLAGPFLVCPDGTRIRSDSAVVYEQTRRAELIGSVDFQSEGRRLNAQLADYFEREARLFARGDVVFRDPARGSEVRGDTMVYLGETPLRRDERLTMSGGRPEALLSPPAGADAPATTPYRVLGERLRFEGERFFWADDDVEVYRDDLEAFADSLVFDRDGGLLFLNGNARLEGDATMEGGQINLVIPEDVLQSITVRRRGRLMTEDLDLVGEEIRITMEDEKIQRLVAVHRESEAGDDPPPRPRALTGDFRLEADSIDVQSPDEILETVHAAGRARGETMARGPRPTPLDVPTAPGDDPELDRPVDAEPDDPDTDPEPSPASEPDPGRPGTEDEGGFRVDRDWIEGDVIVATFERLIAEELPEVDVEPSPDGTDGEASPQYRLTRLDATGNARTLYRSPPQERSDAPQPVDADGAPLWSISYMVARQISIHLADGAVERVEAREQVVGIQLEPERPARDPDQDPREEDE
ncbi:MAG: hypothetical protein EA422_08490 [Gemmatimonadales bacterium]|nr:MAG: hypothetical protein EA422_08490 [Gemmatimonadales bacterium]